MKRHFKRFPNKPVTAEYDIRNDLAETAKSDNANDRLYVAQFPYTPKNILEQLLNDPVQKVRDAAQKMLNKQSKRNRTSTFLGEPITCSDSNRKMSIVSFDFLHDGYYDEAAIENAVIEAMEYCGCELESMQFHEVDYTSYPEYADQSVSQCSCDFSYVGKYNANKLETAIEFTISHLDSSQSGEVIGVNFETYEW